MNIIEQWKPVKGFEGLYEISNLGRVKSLKYGKERIMKPGKNGNGYFQVALRRDGKEKRLLVHRLVAEAFIPNPEGFNQINHKDEVKINNCVENIEWASRSYNINFGSRNEKVSAALINHPTLSKAVEASKYEDFSEICLRFASTMEAGRNGYSSGHVSDCCRGCYCREGNNKYRGLYWRYAS